jgi:hypothetical protein
VTLCCSPCANGSLAAGDYCIDIASHTAALQMHISCPQACPCVCALHIRIASLHVGCMTCPVLRGMSLQIAIDIVQGLKVFASKLPAERAAAFLPELEAAAAPAMPDESADEWQPYLVMLDRLRDRGVKVHSHSYRDCRLPVWLTAGANLDMACLHWLIELQRCRGQGYQPMQRVTRHSAVTDVVWLVQGKTPRAALKKAGARGGRGTAQRPGRRISFAEQDSQEESGARDDEQPEEEVNAGGRDCEAICAHRHRKY